MYIHLIFATKYRKQLLKEVVEEDMKQILFEISQKSDFTIDVMEPPPNFKQSYLLGLKSGNLRGIRYGSYSHPN
ncbi:MAG: transposase [Patescibacteria group bacterium]